jgi:hypothetical protein
MTFLCLSCAHEDAHTNAGSLWCWTCQDELDEQGKQEALERYLGEEKKAAA